MQRRNRDKPQPNNNKKRVLQYKEYKIAKDETNEDMEEFQLSVLKHVPLGEETIEEEFEEEDDDEILANIQEVEEEKTKQTTA